MTCYFRHLKEVFRKAGIEVTSENRRELDKIIRNIVGMESKHCPEVWRKVKREIAEDEVAFVSKLKDAWSKQK